MIRVYSLFKIGGAKMKVEAYFRSFKAANETLEVLKGEGFNHAFVDINDHYNAMNIETNNVGTNAAPSLSDLVLKSGNTAVGASVAPLTAASPMVSGMGGFEEIADVNCKVVVEVDERNLPKIKEIMSKMGADLNSPNVNIPKRLEDIKLENIRFEDIDL
jgi:hypothetical protein